MKMKKVLAALLAGMFVLAGCGNQTETVDMPLEDIMTMVYEDLPEEQTPMMLENTEVTAENIEYYLGTADLDYERALASESGVGSIAHSVVLVKAAENADIAAMEQAIRENVDPRKWICVGVDPKDVIVDHAGDVIILILEEDSSARDTLYQGFQKLNKQ